MLTKRIIPCLDVKNGRVVKGVKFKDHRDAGDPVDLAAFYDQEGADELVFYDITASHEDRDIMRDVVARTAEQVFIPLTVGGGIRSIADMESMLRQGADKISINTAAVERPTLITDGALKFGSQCIVLGLDALRIPESTPPRWEVRIRTGGGDGKDTGLDAIEWASRAVDLGAGEIVANSMDADGTKNGYDVALLRALSESVRVPIVASGGAGELDHFYSGATEGKADALLAASVFHYGTFHISEVKNYLNDRGIPVRR